MVNSNKASTEEKKLHRNNSCLHSCVTSLFSEHNFALKKRKAVFGRKSVTSCCNKYKLNSY